MRTPYSMVLFLAASACVQVGEQSESYYPEDGDAPVISGLDVIGESGNLGGQTVMISGENFGSDPFGVTVVFGSQNAEIKSASASAIIVQAPQGPIEGGAVDVVVGTTEGRSVFEDGYTYDVGDLYQDEVAYVVVNNNWKSCYGGIGSDLGGCETFAYNGLTGIDGRSEILEFVYPRFHSPHVSYWGGTDESDSWQVQV
ncbi:MAG: IPT/TIG domain-containing protein, partial [Myxococcota bacterium]|nr:IPT/TIG domain-containing protein [Myxococcota bacterium]